MAKTTCSKSWEFIREARNALNDGIVLKYLGDKSPRQLQRWSSDPNDPTISKGSSQRNPLDRFMALLQLLCQNDNHNLAISGLSILAQSVGCEIVRKQSVIPDKQSLEEEVLDDYPAVNEFHQALVKDADLELANALLVKAKQELEETFEAYRANLDQMRFMKGKISTR